jgi:thiol-disulfide isomerase/thioredoxin
MRAARMPFGTSLRSPADESVPLGRAAAVAVLALAVLVGASCARRSQAVAGSPAAPLPASGLLQPASASEVKAAVAAARGKVVVVNVWATWCEPCREEFPDLLRLRRERGPRGVELILVSADFERQAAAAESFLREQGVDFPSYLKSGKDMEFIEEFEPRWSGSLPATFVYDRRGRLVEFWEGLADFPTLSGKVAPLL